MVSFIQVDTDLVSQEFRQEAHADSNCVVFRKETTTDVYVVFIENGNNNLVYRKSTDGGATFGSQVLIKTGTGFAHHTVSVWFDQWSPNDTTGTIMHMVATVASASSGHARYYGLDLSNDTFVTNNDTRLDPAGQDVGGARSSTCIIKTGNGELMASYVRNTTAAMTTYVSTDSGATWTEKGGGIWSANGASNDKAQLLPLADSGSDIGDVLAVHYSFQNTRYEFGVYDNGTDSWGSATTLESGLTINTGSTHHFCMCHDKVTGDCYLVYNEEDTNTSLNQQLVHRTFSNATRTFGSKVNVTGDPNSTGDLSLNTISGPSMTRHQDDGVMMCGFCIGDDSGSPNHMSVAFCFSSDNGATWSDAFFIPGLANARFVRVAAPIAMVDPLEGWYANWIDSANDDLEAFNGVRSLEFFSGTVRRRANGPSTPQPLPAVSVTVKGTAPRAMTGLNFGKNRPVYGTAISQSDGTYKVCVFPNWNDEVDTLNFQAQGYLQGATDAGDMMDLSRTDTEV